MTPWLDDAEYDNEFVQVIDWDANVLGFLPRNHLKMLDMETRVIETPKRYLEDPYVKYHTLLAYKRGILTNSDDINDIQQVLLGAYIIKEREFEEQMRIRSFEDNLFASNLDMYKSYMEKKQQDKDIEQFEGVEERVPRNVEEFLEALGAFNEEEDSDDIKRKERVEGWLASILSEEELDLLED